MFKLNVGVVLGIVLFAAPAWSSIITGNNFSFESPVLVAGGSVISVGQGLYEFGDLIGGGIPGWTATTGASTTGIFAPSSTQTPYTPNVPGPVATGATGVPITGVPNDVQVLFLQPGGSVFQNLTTVPGWGVYSVTVDVGRRADVLSGASYSLILTSGSTTLQTTTGDFSSIALGGWAQKTVTYNGAATPSSLRLTLTAADNQVAFDNVRVDAAPEIGGSSVFWTMIGVAGFWIYRRKRLVA